MLTVIIPSVRTGGPRIISISEHQRSSIQNTYLDKQIAKLVEENHCIVQASLFRYFQENEIF